MKVHTIYVSHFFFMSKYSVLCREKKDQSLSYFFNLIVTGFSRNIIEKYVSIKNALVIIMKFSNKHILI